LLNAHYFDGKTSSAHIVSLSLDGPDLLVSGSGFELRYPLHSVRISERLGSTPRQLTFADGSHCEVTDHAALDALLASIGVKHGWLDVLHHSLRWALLAAAATVVFLIVAYRYLLPWGAEALSAHIPREVLQKMGETTLTTLDQHLLQPSKLPAARRQALVERFARLKPLPGDAGHYHIDFRSAPGIGPNAFALPDGSIVLLDELVALTPDDDEIVAVLAHERGHIERRHSARMVLQSSIVGLFAVWYMGDFSTLLTALPVVIIEAGYSRDMEREADGYAMQLLQLNNLSPCLLTSLLDKLEAHQAPKKVKQAPDSPARQTQVLDYLSSHPGTAERAARLCPSR